MNLELSPHNLCPVSGIVNDTDPTFTRHEIHGGAYIDEFIFYSIDTAEEEKIKMALESKLKVDLMDDTNSFLGTASTWLCHDNGHVSVHLSQSVFTEFATTQFSVEKMYRVSNMTLYRSGLPIDFLPPPHTNNPDLKRRTKVYQCIIGSIN